jgi:hypothetical protein
MTHGEAVLADEKIVASGSEALASLYPRSCCASLGAPADVVPRFLIFSHIDTLSQ